MMDDKKQLKILYSLLIYVGCSLAFISCTKTEQPILKLYQVCLQGVTQNQLHLNMPLGEDAKREFNACADGSTEFAIRRLKSLEPRYIEISGNKYAYIREEELETKKADPSIKVYAILILTLVDPDKEKYRQWIGKPNPSDTVLISYTSEVLSIFYLTENTSHEQVQVDIGEDLSLVEPIYNKLNQLVVNSSN